MTSELTYNIKDFTPHHVCDVRLYNSIKKKQFFLQSPQELSPQLMDFMLSFTTNSIKENKKWKIGETATLEGCCFELFVKKESNTNYKICYHSNPNHHDHNNSCPSDDDNSVLQ